MIKFVKPKIKIIASTKMDCLEYEEITGRKKDNSNFVSLSSIAGKVCYNSFSTGEHNINLKKVSGDYPYYVKRLREKGHLSTYEHYSISFMIEDVSRAFTHELVRHRVGVAISQESSRYVRPSVLSFSYYDVESWEFLEINREMFEAINTCYQLLFNEYENDIKHVTSLIRRILPQCVATRLLWTCNVRELIHVIKLRTGEGADGEMKYVFGIIKSLTEKNIGIEI